VSLLISIIKPIALLLFCLFSGAVLACGKPKTGIKFDYVALGAICLACLLL
jgi:hypothetical protein